jgi:hypothetical protein
VLPDIQVEDAFFSPKPKPQSPFARDLDDTQEKKEETGINEDNPPDDWLAPKIYKGSTSV